MKIEEIKISGKFQPSRFPYLSASKRMRLV